MNKETARKILEEYIANNCDLCEGISLPIYDDVVISRFIGGHINEFNQWTFRGLIKIVYDLKDYDK